MDWSNLAYDSLFSSWTPSLLLALCYARDKHAGWQQDVCICVIDTNAVNNEIANADVLIDWDNVVRYGPLDQQVTIEKQTTSLEYMVFGSICRTPALRVVYYKDVLSTNLAQMLPDWTGEDFPYDPFGFDTREAWFGKDWFGKEAKA
jgi:hypothetical protein